MLGEEPLGVFTAGESDSEDSAAGTEDISKSEAITRKMRITAIFRGLYRTTGFFL
jgi:hypothetical protein